MTIRLTLPVALSVAATLHAQPTPQPTPQPATVPPPRALAPGVSHAVVALPDGPWRMHVVRVALDSGGAAVESARAFDRQAGRERTTAMAARRDARACRAGRRVVAALNGDLFEMSTGEGEGLQVEEGVVRRAGRATESPFDTFDNAHVALAIGRDGRAWIDRLAFDGVLRAGDGAAARTAPLDGVNVARGVPAALFTAAYGAHTPRWESRVERTYAIVGRAGDTLRLRRAGAGTPGGGTRIPAAGVVLSAAPDAPAAALLAAGGPATLEAVLRLAPDRGPLRTAMGGWGRLLAAGVDVSARADSLEGTFPRFSARRHPRSAIGVSRDGRTLWLVAVDGRSERSVGMTFGELAPALRALGAWDAMNLDGGGSTTLVIDGRIANAPSDPSGERPVGNALVVTVPDASARRCPAPASTRPTSWDVRDADRATPRPAPRP